MVYCVADGETGKAASYCCGPIQSEAEQYKSTTPESPERGQSAGTFRPTCYGKYTCHLCAELMTFRPPVGKFTCSFCGGEELSGTYRPTCYGKYTCTGCGFTQRVAFSTYRPTCAGKKTFPVSTLRDL